MLGKSLAAALLGIPLAALLVGLPALLSSDQHRTTLPLLMLFYPVWIGVMACAFAFKTGLRAWLWMGVATMAGYGALHLLKACGMLGVAA